MVASIEDTGLLPEIQELLKNILYNENLSETAIRNITQFIEKLDAVLIPPLLPPDVTIKTGSVFHPNSIEVFDVTSPEFLKEQRELSRQGTTWKGKDFVPESLNLLKNGPINLNQIHDIKKQNESKKKVSTKHDKNAIYEKIDSCDIDEKINANKVSQIKSPIPIRSDNPPPVPERKCRLTSTDRSAASPILDRHRNSNKDLVWVHDLQTPLYSGLLRNIRSNTKQWCVIKRHILYLFNDLNEPASFMADLHEYEVFKDPEVPLIFIVRRSGEPTVKLAAVDEEQYQLWLHAFRNAKFLVDSEDGRLDNPGELEDYSEFKDSGGFDQEDFSDVEPYEKPDEMIKKLKTKIPITFDDYEVMNSYDRAGVVGDGVVGDGVVGDGVINQESYNYEEIGFSVSRNSFKLNIDDNADYSEMPLPPIPYDIPPELPPRAFPNQAETNIYSDNDSLSSSFDSLSSDEIDFASNQNSTDKQGKNKWEKEISFFHDLSAVFCGILLQRRMPAIWQKRFCKVKDQSLICYRTPDASEPYLKIPLHGYQLDRAEETWKSFAFKMFKVNSDVFYFAAESRSDLIKWLNVLAKETNKDKFMPGTIGRKKIITDVKQVSYSESNTSNESLSNSILKKPIPDVNSEFEKNSSEKEENNNICKISKEDSFEDHGVVMQGFLLRKFRTHWARRWCCLKDESFSCFKDTTNDDLDVKILLKYATLTILRNVDIGEVKCCFQLCSKEDQKIILSTITDKDWLEWINSLKRFVGSECEETFSYNSVPCLSRSYSHSLKDDLQHNEMTDGYYSMCNELAPTALIDQQVSPRNETELKDSIYCGSVTELQVVKQSFQHIEYFMVLTRNKVLKFYNDITATIPTNQYQAINMNVVDENGADPLILRLHDEAKDKEITLKLSSLKECQNWKNAFLKVHYEQIDADDILTDKRKDSYSNTVNKAKINQPKLLPSNKSASNKEGKKLKDQNSYSSVSFARSLPNPSSSGKRKSVDPVLIYKSDKQNSNDQKKTISELIRSFTVDTLTRKNKNKSYVLNKEDVSLLKETYRGHLKQIIIKDASEIFEERFCRISGKVFYCYKVDSDLKPLFKVPLKNAAIEEFSDIESSIFRFQVTDLNLGKDYLFSLESDTDLDLWVTALFGGDKLQDALCRDSPNNSNKSLPSYNMYDSSRKLSLLLYTEGKNSVYDSITTTANTSNTQSNSIHSLTGSNTVLGHSVETNSACDSSSSLISLGGNVSNVNPTLELHPRISIEAIRLQGNFVEINESSQDHCWLVLKDTILEIFSNAQDQQPEKIIQLSNHFITEKNDESLPINAICLKGENSSYVFVASDSEVCEIWTKELKTTQKIYTQIINSDLNNDAAPVTLRKKLPKLVKQSSISILNDDVKAITKYEKSEDQSTISGGLTELVPSSKHKWKKKNRYCRIFQGFFYISKLSNNKKIIKTIDLSGVSAMDESNPAADKFIFRLDYLKDNKQRFARFQTSNQILADKWMVAVSMGILFHRLSRTIDRTIDPLINEDTHEDFEFFSFSNSLSQERVSKFEPSEQSNLLKEISKDLLGDEGALLETHSLVEFTSLEKPQIVLSLSDNVSENIDKNDLTQSKDNSEQKDNTENTKPEISALTNITDNENSLQNNLLEENKLNFSNDNLNDSSDLLDNIPEKENADETFKNIKGILRQQESIRRAILRRQSTNLKKPPPKIKPKPNRLPASKIPAVPTTTSVPGLASPNLVAMEKYKAQLENKRENLINSIKHINIQVSDARGRSDFSLGKLSSNEKVSIEELQRLRINLHQVEVELNTVYKNINRRVASNIQESDKTPSFQFHASLSPKKSKERFSSSLIEFDESKIDQSLDTQSVII